MTTQPPLLDTGSDLPSPMFRPRPGWGGKLRAWFHENLYLFVFRGLMAFATVLIVASLFHSWRSIHPASPTATPLSGHDVHRETALPGDGMSRLAARALHECLIENPELGALDAVEYFWAVDHLWHSVPARLLHPGDTVDFAHDAVAQLIQAAHRLPPATRQLLLPYLK